jgi:hypothetical protein
MAGLNPDAGSDRDGGPRRGRGPDSPVGQVAVLQSEHAAPGSLVLAAEIHWGLS